MKYVCKKQKSCVWIYEAVTAQCVDVFLTQLGAGAE